MLIVGCGVTVVAGDSLKKGEAHLNKLFKGKTITAKMDLPLIRSVYVTPEGSIDQARYRKRLVKQDPSILLGETAELRKIKVKSDVVHVLINGGGMSGFTMGPGSKLLTSRKKAGSRIEIEFDRKLTMQDLTQEMLLKAVSKVISIQGFEAVAVDARPDETFSLDSPPKTTPAPVASQLHVSILAAEVEPLKPRPGQTISLITSFEISGLASGQTRSIAIGRQLIFQGKPLFSNELVNRGSYGNGHHKATFQMTLPTSASPGVYTYITQIREPQNSEQKETLFVID